MTMANPPALYLPSIGIATDETIPRLRNRFVGRRSQNIAEYTDQKHKMQAKGSLFAHISYNELYSTDD